MMRTLVVGLIVAVVAAGATYLLGREPSSTSMNDSARGTAGSLTLEAAPVAPASAASPDPGVEARVVPMAPTSGSAPQQWDLPASTLPPRTQGDAAGAAPTSLPSEPLDDGAAAAVPDASPTSVLPDGLHHESSVSAPDGLSPTSLPSDGRNEDAPSAAPAGPAPSPTQVPERG